MALFHPDTIFWLLYGTLTIKPLKLKLEWNSPHAYIMGFILHGYQLPRHSLKALAHLVGEEGKGGGGGVQILSDGNDRGGFGGMKF